MTPLVSSDGFKLVLKQDPVDLRSFEKQLQDVAGARRLSLMTPVSKLQDLAFIRRLTELEELHINHLPEHADLTALGALSRLHTITLGDRCPFDCGVLRDLPTLRVFRAGPKTRGLGSLVKCTQLEWVELRGIVSPNCSFLENLPQLRRLRLWDCKLNSIEGLNRCDRLADVDLGRSTMSDLVGFSSLQDLATLGLSYCVRLTDLGSLKNCVNIRKLDVSHCRAPVTAELIEAFPKLESLVCLGVRLSEEACAALLRKPSLQSLSLPEWNRAEFSSHTARFKITFY